MAQKPGIPKGTRDFSPSEVAKRNYIIGVMKRHFEAFGFQPIETPSFENSETLMGKYGEEGDRLIFRVLDSGEYFEKGLQKTTGKSSMVDIGSEMAKIGSELTIFIIKFFEHLRIYFNNNNLNIQKSIFYDRITLAQQLLKFVENEIEGFSFREGVGEMFQYRNLIKEYIITQNTRIVDSILKRNEFFTNNVAFENFKETDLVNLIKEATVYIATKLFSNINSKKLASHISEKALRYDLTVPFARYVVQHQNEIELPFRRYQIQPVWRADRPQKGRFREFYQCDADVVGSSSLWQEVELVQLYDSVFSALGLNGVTIKINNRKVLSGIAEVIGAKDKLIDFTVALDKLDKIGEEGVKKEMLEKGITASAIEKVQPLFSFTGSINEKLDKLEALLSASAEGRKGVEELRFICDTITAIGLDKSKLDLDVTLARGLNYYTGAILEVAAPDGVAMGSIGGGGRYDDLTGIFGLKNISGVGISFGLDRIYLVLEELGLFPETVTEGTRALFINFGDREALYALKAMSKLREQGIKVELYPDTAKIGKQFQHADKREIPFAVLTGDEEISNGLYTLKDLKTGQQDRLTLEELTAKLK